MIFRIEKVELVFGRVVRLEAVSDDEQGLRVLGLFSRGPSDSVLGQLLEAAGVKTFDDLLGRRFAGAFVPLSPTEARWAGYLKTQFAKVPSG